MGTHLFAPPVREARLIVVLATVTWLPIVIVMLARSRTGGWPGVIAEAAVLGATALPLLARTRRGFRACALTLGWLILGLEALCCLPWGFIPLIVILPLFPAGGLLLIAAGRSAHATRLIVSMGITALAFVFLLGGTLATRH